MLKQHVSTRPQRISAREFELMVVIAANENHPSIVFMDENDTYF